MTIRLACHTYDCTAALIRGLVRSERIELSVSAVHHSSSLRIFRGEFDAGEFSLAEFVYYASREPCDLVGIPVFPLRMFRHASLFCKNAAPGIKSAAPGIDRPRHLQGKKIGFPGWVQTASVWVRGMLAEEYGVSPENTSWFTPAIHHWEDAGQAERIQPRDGSVVRMLDGEGRDPNEALLTALVTGELDAVAVAGPSRPLAHFPERDNRFRRLFENIEEAETAYFNKTGIFPIIHLLVARKPAVDRFPELPEKLFQLFVRSKRLGPERRRDEGHLGAIGGHFYPQDERGSFQSDACVYGLARNRRVLEKFLHYCYQQGISRRRLVPEELFVPATRGLDEEDF